MNKGAIYTIHSKAEDFPGDLRQIPQPPGQLHIIGSLEEFHKRPRLAVVGSRKITAYGKAVTAQLAGEAARAGIVIVSGLALGVDAAAHRAALETGGVTVAVLAGGLDSIHPRTHTQLARQIVAQGGALLSEYPSGVPSHKSQFVERNRLVSGLSAAILITEATEKSGTLHTARFALEQGKDVLVVPGNITSPTSQGTNTLLKSGATPVTCIEDVLHILGVSPQIVRPAPKGSTPEEQSIIDLLIAGHSDGSQLLIISQLSTPQFNQTITMLEITGKIRSLGGNQWSL